MRAWELVEISRTKPSVLGFWSVEQFALAHKFLFDHYKNMPQESIDFAADLCAKGIMRLPFNWTIMEFPCSDDKSNVERIVVLCNQFYEPPPSPTVVNGEPYCPDMFISLLPIVRGKDRSWSVLKDQAPLITISTGNADERNRNFGVPPAYFERRGWGELAKTAANCCQGGVVSLMSKNTKTENLAVPAAISRARTSAGKPPIYSFTVVSVPSQPILRGPRGSGTHASPRLHWRRGHFRHLSRGAIIPVAPCLVGSADNGSVEKAYDVRV